MPLLRNQTHRVRLTNRPEGHQGVVDRFEVRPFLLPTEDERAAEHEHRRHAELDGDELEAGHFLSAKAKQTLETSDDKRDDRIQPLAN